MFDRFFRAVFGEYRTVGVSGYEHQLLESIAKVGVVKMSDVTVLGAIAVTGSVKAETCKLNTVKVTGTVTINDSEVGGQTNIAGSVNAVNTKFEDELKLATNRSVLTDSSTQNIVVTETQESKLGASRELHLLGDTIVNGNIHFEGGNGSIFKSRNAVIHGDVLGAIVNNALENHL